MSSAKENKRMYNVHLMDIYSLYLKITDWASCNLKLYNINGDPPGKYWRNIERIRDR